MPINFWPMPTIGGPGLVGIGQKLVGIGQKLVGIGQKKGLANAH